MVLARNLREGPKWLQGRVLSKDGPVSYTVGVCGQVWKQHIDQLLACHGQEREMLEPAAPQIAPELPAPEEDNSVSTGVVEPPSPAENPGTENPEVVLQEPVEPRTLVQESETDTETSAEDTPLPATTPRPARHYPL